MPEATSADHHEADAPNAAVRSNPMENAGGTDARAERVSVIVGTRLCIRCGFNLTGQTILREPTYDLLIARCPECGAVAPLQEYPPLGSWQRRWSVLLAVLWFAVVALLALLTTALPTSLANTIAMRQTMPISSHIASQWGPVIKNAMQAVRDGDDSVAALPLGMQALAQQYASWYTAGYTDLQIDQWIAGGSIPIDASWWKDNRAAVLAAAPGTQFNWVRNEPFFDWVLHALICAAVGSAWAAILLHLRLRGRLVFCVALALLSALSLWAAHPNSLGGNMIGVAWNPYYVGQMNAWSLAYEHIWFEAALTAVVIAAVPFLIGLFFGRPLVRLLARLLLPPRACQAIAPLWLCDGKTPPRTRPR